MPREVKKKAPLARNKKKNGYVLPESIGLGEILTDVTNNQWKIGPSIGIGGFGEIYSACNAKKPTKKIDDYEYVIKIEPSENGPLFVEMHFYKRNAKQDDIKNFMKNKGLKSLGMPYLLGSGSHEINGKKHRFIVMPRYGQDIASAFMKNKNKLPEHTIYRLAIQMLDVYEYIHQCTYIHADLKGANILLGFGKTGGSQAYLVDFGLASHYTTKDFKPDPKRMHNGTIEYTSRDAHLGVPTIRSDFEILCYNIIHWSGVTLPWEADKLLTNPLKVQKSKEDFMKNIDLSLKKLYIKNIPEPIKQYMKYISTLQYNETPDYDKCRQIFEIGLKNLGKKNSGKLDIEFTGISKTNLAKTTTPTRNIKPPVSDDMENSDEDIILPSPKEKLIKMSPMKRKPIHDISEETVSPKKSKTIKTSPVSVDKKRTKSINYSPVVNINRNINTSAKKLGKTVINDNLTPNANSKKTYEFNFELDVSLDANVIVNVKRKKKPVTKQDDINGDETPQPRVLVRRLPRSAKCSVSPKQKSK